MFPIPNPLDKFSRARRAAAGRHPREGVPLGSYLDLALWLLGRNPLVADLVHRIPGVVTTGPEGTTYNPTRLALTIRARDRVSVA